MHRRTFPGRAAVAAGLAVLLASGAAPGRTAVRVTGRLLDADGQTDVPRGLFGVHATMTLTPELVRDWGIEAFRQIHFLPGSGSVAIDKAGALRPPFRDLALVIDCQGDRFHPAPVLTNPGYEEFFRRIGRDYAQRCKDLGWNGCAEFWNEPYLNWADRSRKNYDPKFYDVSRAADDGPVTIKGWDRPLRHLRWRRLWAADETGKIVHLVPVPPGAGPGDTFRHRLDLYFTDNREQTYTVVERWDVYDPTQVSFWSGKQNYDFYMWMLLPWARAVKETHPAVTVLAGWDFAVRSDGWKAWDLLVRPMIDEAVAWIDGVTEHHYGSDTRINTASYEVIVGYALAEHGKRLRCYNTETAGCADPAVPGGRHGAATPYGAFNYGLRDIVELLYRCPEKAAARIAHGSTTPGWGGGGDEFLFKLLKDLRGRLVHASTDDPDVWPVAALNGSRLVLVLFSDHPAERRISLALDAPAGTTFADGRKAWVVPTAEGGPVENHEEAVPARGRRFEADVVLPPRAGVKFVFPLQGAPPHRPALLRRQSFARGVLQRVEPGRPLALAVRLDAALLARAESACVKVVLEGVAKGEATVRVNGTPVRLPDRDWTTEVPVPPAILRPDTTLEFETAGDGYQVDVASIVIEAPAP